MARWIVVSPGPDYSVHDVYTGWMEGLKENGQQIFPYNFNDRLAFYDNAYEKIMNRGGPDVYRKALNDEQSVLLALDGLASALWKLRPQVLLMISGLFADFTVLEHARKAYGTYVIVLHTESPYEDGRQIKVAEHADLNMVNDPVSVQRFNDAGIYPVIYAPHAYRPHLHCPGPAEPKMVCDLGFVGTGFKSRVQFFHAMDLDGIDFKLGGGAWHTVSEPDDPLQGRLIHPVQSCMDNTDAVRLYRAMRCGINLYRREAESDDLMEGHGCGPREIEMAACGAFFLRDPRPESDRLFPMLPSFDSPGDASEKLRWWLAHEDQRKDAALKAREAVADRSFTRHAAELIRMLGL